ncbi:MAG: gamma-glutamyl-gamma-aminobutyrate hydrolase family protein [Prevotellaceae bacterium]|jgi:putative glutamine amidotransferase|nr:gamma-glutamyl-gamma-aminobutyrate hydrolase family protein [Prevotellaceae bacterium]
MKTLITQRESVDQYGSCIDSLGSEYIGYFQTLGCQLFPVSNFTTRPAYLYDQMELLILTGGGSIAGLYYSPVRIETDSPNRDYVEKLLFEEAIQRHIPIIAICRGMQYVNALLGGQLSVLNLKRPRPIAMEHPIILNNKPIYVNNYHNDGIYEDQLSADLLPIGIDTDNDVIEACIGRNHPILGMQFHPERTISDSQSRKTIDELIANFIANKF